MSLFATNIFLRRKFNRSLCYSVILLILLTVPPSILWATNANSKLPDRSFLSIQPDSIQNITSRGKLIVAMYNRDVKPFYYKNANDDFTGIDVELMKGFARLLKVGITFDRSSGTFDAVINKVARHEADVGISKLGMTFSRAMRIRYTDPYIILHQGLLVNRLELTLQEKGRHQVEVIKDLRGKIGVIANSSYVDNAKERFKHVTVQGYPTWNDVIDAAVKGKVVAAYRDDVEIKKIIRDRPDTAIKFLSVVLSDAEDPKAMVVAWDDPYLQYLLNFYIKFLNLNLTANMVLDHFDETILKIRKKTTLK